MRSNGLLVVLLLAVVAGIAGGILWVFHEIGAERIFSLAVASIAGGLLVVLVRVALTGAAKIAEAKKPHAAPERHLIKETKIIDGRPQTIQLPQAPAPDASLIFPAALAAAWRQGIDAGGQDAGEVIDGQAQEAQPARRVWQ